MNTKSAHEIDLVVDVGAEVAFRIRWQRLLVSGVEVGVPSDLAQSELDGSQQLRVAVPLELLDD